MPTILGGYMFQYVTALTFPGYEHKLQNKCVAAFVSGDNFIECFWVIYRRCQ
jgi:hypothetical protein